LPYLGLMCPVLITTPYDAGTYSGPVTLALSPYHHCRDRCVSNVG
jgi:hypothetical protein